MALSAEAGRILSQLKEGGESALRVMRGSFPVPLLRELYVNEGDDYDVQYFLAGHFETPSKILEELASRSQSPMILARLAENMRTPKPLLQQLARHERTEVRKAVASGKGISPQAALILAEDPDAMVRAVLAENPAVTPRVQVILSQDAVPFVRAALLKVPKLDEEIQFALCDDVDVAVQAKALLAPRLSGECLLRWADGDEGLSQRILLLRGQLPENVLESLLFSKDEYVKQQAIARKQLTEDEMVGLARTGDDGVRMRIASMNGVPPLVQMMLAREGSAEVRLALSGNPWLGKEAFEVLLETGDSGVDCALADNASVPPSWLMALPEARRSSVLAHIAAREALTDADAALLAASGDDAVLYRLWYDGRVLSGVDGAVLRRLARHPMPSVRELAARARGLTIALMAELRLDSCPLVRLALAENEDIIPSFLKTLSEDSDARVAKAAARRLASMPCEEPPAEGVAGQACEVVSESVGGGDAVPESCGGAPESCEGAGGVEEPQRGGLLRRFMSRLGRKS